MKLFKRILSILVILVVLLVGTGLVLSLVYEKEVKNFVIAQVNKHLKTEIQVEDYNFSFLKKFPDASLEFQNVLIDEVSDGGEPDTLLFAESIFLEFSLKDVFNKNYRIKAIHARNGSADLLVDAAGNANYIFWEAREEKSENFSFELTRVLFEHMKVAYRDEEKGFHTRATLNNARFSGNFSAEKYTLNIKADTYCKLLQSSGTKLLAEKDVDIDTKLEVNRRTQEYQMTSTTLLLEELRFQLQGSILQKVDPKSLTSSKMLVLDLKSSGEQLPLADLRSLLPAEYADKLEGYKADGMLTYGIIVHGNWGNERVPFINFNFEMHEGTFLHEESGVSLGQISLKGVFSNGDQQNLRTTELYLETFDAHLGKSHFKGNMKIRNFNTPFVRFSSSSEIYLEEALPFFGLDTIEEAQGKMTLDLKSSGAVKKLGSISPEELRAASTNGILRMEDVSFQVQDSPYHPHKVNGTLKFNNNDVKVEKLQGMLGETDFLLQGYFRNLFSFLLFKEEKLYIKSSLTSERVFLDELLSKTPSKKNSSDYKLSFSPRIVAVLHTRIRKLTFRNFEAEAIAADFRLNNRVLSTSNLNFRSMNGNIASELKVDGRDEKQLKISVLTSLDHIDIRQLFHDFENFGQNTLAAENIDGTVTADVRFSSLWSKELKIDPASVHTLADLSIENGKLIEFDPLMQLSDYIAVDELKNVSFSRLKNQVEIKDEVIHIPDMDIHSSALDLKLKGKHHFDNTIDYRVRLKMQDILWNKAKKAKRENSEFGYVVEDEEDTGYLFLKMTGKADDAKISYDTEGLAGKWKSDIKEEKQTVKGILKEEFGLFKGDTTVKAPDDNKKDDDAPYQIEWEEAEEDKKEKEEKSGDRANRGVKKENEGKDKEEEEKSGLGKFFNKITEPNEEEFVQPEDVE